ncbi:glycoside hydrolase family 9 protein [Sphingomonas sp. PB2P12]|uniref:glycoside hydrolase family 9 protein n=1 Tax=Sphingomonas sandaracina TaxID=3096157 RepID=UPI002FCA17DD
MPFPLLLAAAVINLNQLGFRSDDPKRAIVADVATRPLDWVVVDDAGRTVLTGRTSVGGNDMVSGDHVHLATFSALTRAGTYRLRVDGADSGRFRIGRTVYAPLALNALNFFYQQRAGTPIEARWAGARWARAAGHPHEVAGCFSGADEKGNVWPGCPYTLDVTGGWYDAGDQGKYVVNAGIAVWTLQNLYETRLARRLFADGQARLPEAGNGHDDLLDEARWEVEWMLRMQVPAGSRLALPIGPQDRSGKLTLTAVDAGGMAHHKVADAHWTALPTAPADDKEPRLLYPPSTAATLNLAAVAAQAARLWKPIDPAFAARCLAAAQAAWTAAQRNPAIFAAQGFTGSGGYGDETLDDERAWAAAELFATTGDVAYRASLPTGATGEPGWPSVAPLGTITLATASGVPAAIRDSARTAIVTAADGFLAEIARSGYRIPYASQTYSWGSNSTVLNRAMLLGLAQRFTGDARYRAGVVDAADYILGRNPLGQSYVSGTGWKPLTNPHHRFWAHQLSSAYPPPPPGAVSGGPNNSAMADPVAMKLKGHCAPQRCWADDINAYALNEVAINWNAPLVWVAAYLDGD